MNEITILHLSDIHFKKKKDQDNKTFYLDVQQKLIHTIKSHTEDQGNPDFVTITGDITYSGKASEYKEALVFFDQLKTLLPGETCFLPVPGNHDVDRRQVDEFCSLRHNVIEKDLIDKFLEKPEQIKKKINVKFKAFRKFSNQLNPGYTPYEYKEDYFWVKDFPEKGISFLGLNSSWASEGDKERFNIALGFPQLMAALEKSKLPNKVVLMHHPPVWLKDMESGKTRVELFKNCQLLLHGHNHFDNTLVFKDPSNSIICLGANASYTDDKDGFIGFQFITVRFFKKGAAVRVKVWPYIFSERRNEFVPDQERWEAQGGKPYFVIETEEIHKPSPVLEIPEDYKEWIEEFHSILPVDKLTRKGESIILRLHNFYIPLETINPHHNPIDKIDQTNEKGARHPLGYSIKENEKAEEPITIDIEELFSRENFLLVRGNAGMGKTTLIKHLAYSLTHGSGHALLKGRLPVLIFLKDFWPIYKNEIKKKHGEITSEALLEAYLKKHRCPLTIETIKNFSSQKRALFLLDGLDEVPENIRGDLVDLVCQFKFDFKKNYFLITGRPHGIEGKASQYFEKIHDIEELDKKKISEFISKWLQAVSSKDIDLTEVNAEDMISDIQLHKHAELFTQNPLHLTALCIFYLESGKRIPDQRAELFDRIISNLLYRRFHNPAEPENVNKVQEYLMLLAFTMHTQNIKSIEAFDAMKLLKETYPNRTQESLYDYKKYIREQFNRIEPVCGLLNRQSSGEIEFSNLSLQEFLAARHMLYRDISYIQYMEDPGWEQIVLFYISLMNLKTKKYSNKIIQEILTTYTNSHLQWLGFRALWDFQPSRREESVVNLARKKLINLIESDASLEDRFEASEILGALGDFRIKFTPVVSVEAGEFTRGANKYKWEKPIRRIYLDEFMIGKYPVTNEEFEAFIREGGYDNKGFWTSEGWEWRKKENISTPQFWHDREWNGPNFPVVGVSWYEACAYAKCLSKKTGDLYVLPTEAQWEKAARGPDGSFYPWGEEFDSNICNTNECRLNRSNPVGIFPGGKSPYGCFDMSGNVWEWCLDWYDENYYKESESPGKNPQGPLTGSFRVLRGGSWYNGAWRSPGVFRDYDEPQDRLNCVGFRLVRLVEKVEEEIDPKIAD